VYAPGLTFKKTSNTVAKNAFR